VTLAEHSVDAEMLLAVQVTGVALITFTLLAVCQWFNALNCESPTRSVLRLGVLKNPWLLGGLLLANLLQAAVVFTVPMNRFFHTVPIPLQQILVIGAVASSVLWVEEIRKLAARKTRCRRGDG